MTNRVIMVKWDRSFCPECHVVWDRNGDGAWRYVSLMDIPVPPDHMCPMCSMGKTVVWTSPLPALPQDNCGWKQLGE